MGQKMIGFCLIIPSWTQRAEALLKSVEPYFDKLYVQINGRDHAYPHDFLKDKKDKLDVSYFKWCDDFAAARNALLDKVETDWWVWADEDDTVTGAENLRDIVEQMERDGIDRIFSQYLYAQNDIGEEIAPHWRERVIRKSHPFRFVGVVHETLISEEPDVKAKTEALVVHHNKSQADYDESIARNYRILLKEYDKEPRDPRITMYLGLTLFTMRQWAEAIEKFIEHIHRSGSVEDQYRSWLKVAECHQELGNLDKAISAALEATKLLPHYPDAYFALGMFYYRLEDYGRTLEWFKVGMAKPNPETLAIVDPTMRYRVTMMGALAEFQRGNVEEAWKLINAVKKVSPRYKLMLDYYDIFETAYLEQEAIERAKWLIAYTATKQGKPLSVIEALPAGLKLDFRLQAERNKVYPPKTWGEKSIVFFCGQTAEAWGPDTLDRGMGGSEEAVVYLSRELVKQGYEVTVYCERDSEYEDVVDMGPDFHDEAYPVTYLPWHTINLQDTFATFVAWRNPGVCRGVKAKLTLCDIHDVMLTEDIMTNMAYVDRYLVKSQYHRSLYPDLPEEKVAVIGNGLVLEQFQGDRTKKPHSVGYFSSYDRNLETLLAMWPKIRERVPDATLEVAYGWSGYDHAHRGNAQKMRWRWEMTRKMYLLREQGVTEHGRLSHEALAKMMLETKVLAYPSDFHEIFMITMIKALMAGMIPVTTGVGAVIETQGGFGATIRTDTISTDVEYQEEFVDKVIEALENENYDPKPAQEFASQFSWDKIAEQWAQVIK